jgi:glycosidase
MSPDKILLAESEKPDEMVKAFDISYNFSHLSTLQRIFVDREPASALRANWERSRQRFPRGTRFLRGSDNHDQGRAIVLFAQRGALTASVINACLDGLPFLYNGQEIADTTATDHQSRFPLRWELDMPEGQAGSGLARGQKSLSDW